MDAALVPSVLRICTWWVRQIGLNLIHNHLDIPSQHTFRTPHLPLPPLDPGTSHPTRPRQRLECTFRPVMIITPPNDVHMQRHPRRHGPTAQPMVHHLTVQLPDHRRREIEIADEEGAGRYVEDGAGERFVEGRVAMAEAGETGAGAEGAGEGGPEREEGVFRRVVVVDCSCG